VVVFGVGGQKMQFVVGFDVDRMMDRRLRAGLARRAASRLARKRLNPSNGYIFHRAPSWLVQINVGLQYNGWGSICRISPNLWLKRLRVTWEQQYRAQLACTRPSIGVVAVANIDLKSLGLR
jgi:hypothetical protein